MSTVKILRSLNEGYKVDVRGKTELKVAEVLSRSQLHHHHRHVFIKLCFYREKELKRRTGLWERQISQNLCQNHLRSSQGKILKTFWVKTYYSSNLFVMSLDLCHNQGRQPRAKAWGDCCIQEKESSVFSASTGGRNLHVVWWQFGPLPICACLVVFDQLLCGLLIYWLYHVLHLLKQIEESLPLFYICVISRFGVTARWPLDVVYFTTFWNVSFVFGKVCQRACRFNSTLWNFSGITGKRWWRRKSKLCSGRPRGRWRKRSEPGRQRETTGQTEERDTKSWLGQAKRKERRPGYHCGPKRTCLRGLFVAWLICLPPAQQNTVVLM